MSSAFIAWEDPLSEPETVSKVSLQMDSAYLSKRLVLVAFLVLIDA